MKSWFEIPKTVFQKSLYRSISHCLLFLLLFIFPTAESSALEPGASVYVREGTHNDADWTPAEYVGERSDCLILKRIRPYPWEAPFLKIPAAIQEENVKIGQEVNEVLSVKPLPNAKLQPIVDRVLAVRQNCHEVKHAGGPFRLYVLPGNVLATDDFLKLRGSAKQFSEGDKVYAKEYGLTPEHWSLRKIIAKRDDCFETDSDRVLCGNYGEDEYLGDRSAHIFGIPPTISKLIRKGDTLDDFTLKVEKSAEGAAYTTLEGVVESKSKDTLIVKSSNEDCSYSDPIRIADLRQAPSPLPLKDFAALKVGDVVLERFEPACCCCNPYYTARKIVSQKRGGYLLQKEKDGYVTEAGIPSQLIPAEAFGK